MKIKVGGCKQWNGGVQNFKNNEKIGLKGNWGVWGCWGIIRAVWLIRWPWLNKKGPAIFFVFFPLF